MLIYVDMQQETNKFSFLFPLDMMTHDIRQAIEYPFTLLLYVGWHQDITNLLVIVEARASKNLKTKLILDGRSEETGLMAYKDFHEETVSKIISRYDHLLVSNEVVNREPCSPFYCNTLTVDLLGLVSYKRCFIDGDHPVNVVPVEHRKNGTNLLVGKIKTRFSRFVTLYQFYKHKMFDDAVVGIHADPQDIRDMARSHPEYNDENFVNYVINRLGPADNTELIDTNEGKTAASGWPFGTKIYSNTSVSYVCETFDYDKGIFPFFVNEKIYKPIINKHPFIVQGSPGQLETVKKLGYMTFSDIIDESYNNEYLPNGMHVEPAVIAAKNLVHKIPENKNLVQEIVDYNFNHFCRSMNNHYKHLLTTINDFANSVQRKYK